MKLWLTPKLIWIIWWVAELLLRASRRVDSLGVAVTRWGNK